MDRDDEFNKVSIPGLCVIEETPRRNIEELVPLELSKPGEVERKPQQSIQENESLDNAQVKHNVGPGRLQSGQPGPESVLEVVDGFRDRLAQMRCLFLPDTIDIALIDEFYLKRPEARDPRNSADRIVDVSQVKSMQGILVTYEVWCFIFRECVISRKGVLADRMITWLLSFISQYPPQGIPSSVEQIRLYLALRAGYQAKFITKAGLGRIIDILNLLSLDLLLPFMPSSTDVGEFSESVIQVFGIEGSLPVNHVRLLKQNIKARSSENFKENGNEEEEEEEEEKEGEEENALESENFSDSSSQSDGISVSDSESSSEYSFTDSDSDSSQSDADFRLLETAKNNSGLDNHGGNVSGNRNKNKKQSWTAIRKGSMDFDLFINRALHGIAVTDKYETVCSIAHVCDLRKLALKHKYCGYGSIDKKLLTQAFRSRTTRSLCAVAFMKHLHELETHYLESTDLDIKFRAAQHFLLRFCRMFPLPLALAQSLYTSAVKLATRANELDYSFRLRNALMELTRETNNLMNVAFDSARAVTLQSINSVGMNGGGRVGGGRSSIRLSAGAAPAGPDLAALNAEGEALNNNKITGISDDPTSAVYDSHFFRNAPPSTLIAKAYEVWLQVDKNMNSIMSNAPELVGEDEMTSINHGVMRVFKNRITWVLVQSSVLVRPPGRDSSGQAEAIFEVSDSSFKFDPSFKMSESGKALDFASLAENELENDKMAVYNAADADYGVSEHYLAEYKRLVIPPAIAEEKTALLQDKVAELTKPIAKDTVRLMQMSMSGISSQSMAKSQTAGVGNPNISGESIVELPESQFTIRMQDIQRYTWGTLDESSTYIAIYTMNEVVKLFPFGKRETSELLKMLHSLTGVKNFGLGPSDVSQYKEKLDDLRLVILHETILPKGRGVWISHTEELWHVLRELTKDDSPLRLSELERVYHSCRVNKQVVAESIQILKELWPKARSQDTIVKIIAIVDRFLDGDIFKGDDEILAETLRWLHAIETTLDPTVNATPLKMLLRVCHRAEALQSQTIVPLVEYMYDADLFEMRSAMKKYRQGYF